MSKRNSLTEQARLQCLLKSLRKKAGLRQVDLAERLGQPQSFVSKFESGERRLDVLELRQVCQILGVSLEQFAARLEELAQVKPDPRFLKQDKTFWANVRTISQHVGYTVRGKGFIKVPTLDEITAALAQ